MIRLILLSILLLLSCDRKNKATGSYDKIYVFGDKTLFDDMKESLRITLGAPFNLPVEEYRYKLEYRTYEEFDRYKVGKNVLFLIARDRESPLNSVPDHLLGPNAKAAMERGELNFFMAKNAYAENQALLFYVVNKAANAEAEFLEQFFRISTFDQFNNYTLDRLSADMYSYDENEASSEHLSSSLDISFRHPARFNAVDFSTHADSIQFSLFANSPTRWVWAKSVDLEIGDTLNAEFVADIRDTFSTKYLEGDSVDRTSTIYSSRETKDGIPYVRVQGSYITYADSTRTPIGGGPFISYAFYDKAKKRMWLIDGHLYLPGKRKSLRLLELEAILRTFSPRQQKDEEQ